MPASSGAEESDQQREAEAYNWNIYVMVATPYLLVAAVALCVYRALRRKARMEQAASRGADASPAPNGFGPLSGADGG